MFFLFEHNFFLPNSILFAIKIGKSVLLIFIWLLNLNPEQLVFSIYKILYFCWVITKISKNEGSAFISIQQFDVMRKKKKSKSTFSLSKHFSCSAQTHRWAPGTHTHIRCATVLGAFRCRPHTEWKAGEGFYPPTPYGGSITAGFACGGEKRRKPREETKPNH